MSNDSKKPDRAQRNPHQGSVLIVEDESELRFIIGAHLRAAGYEVLDAGDGAEAIGLAQELQPDLIIMDIGLPVLDGIAATRQLKAEERTAHIPIIMLTARSGSNEVVRGLEAGAQEYLPKPFDVAELLARVQTVLRLALARRDLGRLNTQLEAEIDHKTQKLRMLYEFMRDLNLAGSRDRILDLLLRCIVQTTAANRVSVFLTDSTGEYLVCERGVGLNPATIERIRVSEMEGVTGQVFRSGKTLAAKTYDTRAKSERAYASNEFLSTPLVSASLTTPDGIIGVLNVTEREDAVPFSEEQIECIRSIADASAIALDNVTRRARLQQSVRVLLQTVGHLAEYRDEETTSHLERVTKLSRVMADQLAAEGPYASEINEEFIELLVQAAPMHDIGKVGIPDDILTKPGALTDEEYQIMKTHTDIGRRVLSRAFDPACPVPMLQMCIDIAHCHHERFDGKGYPRRLSGDAIPLSARIIAIVDAYDAITSRRRYKKSATHEKAVEIIRSESGDHFDPVLVDAFIACHEQFDEIRERHDEPVGATDTVPA